jgi:hypothetical protein
MSDFSHAIRGLRRSPALVAVAILSLALGIGTNVTVFSVVREMILDDMSARLPERLTRVDGMDVSYALYRDLQWQVHSKISPFIAGWEIESGCARIERPSPAGPPKFPTIPSSPSSKA